MVDSILSAAKDLFKYRIIQYVNTGDKTYDNLLQGVYLAILTAVFGIISLDFIKKQITDLYYRCKRQTNTDTISVEVAKYHNDRILANTSIIVCSWKMDGEDGQAFTSNFKCYVYSKASWMNGDIPLFNPKTLAPAGVLSEASRLESIVSYFNLKTSLKYVPLLIKNGQVAGILYRNGSVLCFGETKEILNTMLKDIQCFSNSSKTKLYFSRNIFIHDTKKTYELYDDRNMDIFISKHKPKILQLLRNFQEVNKGISKYNGFGSYNLGFMVHGKPGTGKTFFIKAVCNYLNRDAYIIDMRKIKTMKALEKIFIEEYTVHNYVIVFDEFDCVQDVIRDRSDSTTIDPSRKDSAKLSELRSRHMELLKMSSRFERTESKRSSKSTSEEDDGEDSAASGSSSVISKQLSKIEQEIADTEDSLNLYSLLTLLDGMIEMRGRVIIATTNYLDRIDSALLREGRFDMKLNLDAFDDAEAHELLHKMFDSIATEEQLKRLANIQIKPNMYTPAQIVNLVLSLNDLDAVLDVIKK